MAPRRKASSRGKKQSNDGTTKDSSLLSRLIPIYEKVQTDEDIVAGEKRIQSVLQEHALVQGVDQLHIDNDDVAEDSNNNLAEALSHIIDCSIHKGLNDCSRPIFRLLAVTLTMSHQHHDCTSTLLDRVIAFSACGTEYIRSAATFLLVQWFEQAVASASAVTEQEDEEHQHALLDRVQEALLARYTDKAVSVRAAALVSTPEDPNLRSAVLWMVQHDPSAANRTLAATCLAGSMAATDYFVQRVRDVHKNVRVAAIQTCLRAHPEEACRVLADVVEAGWTERYVRS